MRPLWLDLLPFPLLAPATWNDVPLARRGIVWPHTPAPALFPCLHQPGMVPTSLPRKKG